MFASRKGFELGDGLGVVREVLGTGVQLGTAWCKCGVDIVSGDSLGKVHVC